MTTIDLFKLVSLSITRHDDHRDVLQVALHGDAGVVAWSTVGNARPGEEDDANERDGKATARLGRDGGRLQATAPFGTEEGSVGAVHGSLFHELRSSRCINSIRDQSNQLTSASSIPHVNLNSDNTT
nr:uncharacterized protein LOC117864832 [Setaria viridis]